MQVLKEKAPLSTLLQLSNGNLLIIIIIILHRICALVNI